MPGEHPYKPEQAQIAVAVEPTQGETATPTRAFGLIQEDISLPDPSIQWIEERVIGHNREIFNKVDGQRAYDGGSIPIVPYDGAPIAYILGNESVAVDTDIDGNAETGTTTHTLTLNYDEIPATQTIEAGYQGVTGQSNFVRTFSGCLAGSGEIAVNNEGELQTSLDYIAMGVDTGTSLTSGVEPESREPWLFKDVTSNLQMFGTSFARVEQFSLSITNNLDEGRYIQENNPEDPYEITYGNIEYELSASITVDDNSLYQELVGPTEDGFTTQIEFEKPGSGESLRIIAENCNIPQAPHDIPQENVISTDVAIIPEHIEIKVEDAQSAGTGYLDNASWT